MLLMLVTLLAATNAAKLRGGQQPPPGAAEAGGDRHWGAPIQGSNPPGYGGKSGSFAGPAAPVVAILSYSNQPNLGDGSYSYSFEADNGIQAKEAGGVVDPEKGTSVQGSYSYISPDGQTISVSYTAGEGGFVPLGDHIPIPKAILKALAKNATDEAAGIFDIHSHDGGPRLPVGSARKASPGTLESSEFPGAVVSCSLCGAG